MVILFLTATFGLSSSFSLAGCLPTTVRPLTVSIEVYYDCAKQIFRENTPFFSMIIMLLNNSGLLKNNENESYWDGPLNVYYFPLCLASRDENLVCILCEWGDISELFLGTIHPSGVFNCYSSAENLEGFYGYEYDDFAGDGEKELAIITVGGSRGYDAYTFFKIKGHFLKEVFNPCHEWWEEAMESKENYKKELPPMPPSGPCLGGTWIEDYLRLDGKGHVFISSVSPKDGQSGAGFYFFENGKLHFTKIEQDVPPFSMKRPKPTQGIQRQPTRIEYQVWWDWMNLQLIPGQNIPSP